MTRKSSVMRRVTVALATTMAVSAVTAFALWNPKQSKSSPSAVVRVSDACYAAQDESPVQNSGLRVLATKVLSGRSITFRAANPSVAHKTQDDWDAEFVETGERDENGNAKHKLVHTLTNGYWHAHYGNVVANADGSFTYTAPNRAEVPQNRIDYIFYQPAENSVDSVSRIPVYIADAPEDATAPNEYVGGNKYAIEGATNAPLDGNQYELPAVNGDTLGKVTVSGQQGTPSVVSLRLTEPEWSEPDASQPSTQGSTQSQRVQTQDPVVIDFDKECNTTGTWVEYGDWHQGKTTSTGWSTVSKWKVKLTAEMASRILKRFGIKLASDTVIEVNVQKMTFRSSRWRMKNTYKCVKGESVLVSQQVCTEIGVGVLFLPTWMCVPEGVPEDGAFIWVNGGCK